jgi:hypothetical protein
LKINQTVKDKVGITLSDRKGLLRLALYSLIESIRIEPVKFSSLVYSISNSISLPGQQQYISSQDCFIEYYTSMIVQEAEKLYNTLVKDLVNRVIDDAAFTRSSALSSSSRLLSSSADRQQQQPSSSPGP